MVDSLTLEQIAAFKETFKSYDQTGDGRVSISEMVNKMKPLSQEVQATKLADMLTMMQDTNETPDVSFPEFIYLMGSTLKDEHIERELELAFRSIVKKGGDAGIDKNTFRRVFANLGETVTDEELNRVLRHFNSDKKQVNDFVDFEEFYKAMLK